MSAMTTESSSRAGRERGYQDGLAGRARWTPGLPLAARDAGYCAYVSAYEAAYVIGAGERQARQAVGA